MNLDPISHETSNTPSSYNCEYDASYISLDPSGFLQNSIRELLVDPLLYDGQKCIDQNRNNHNNARKTKETIAQVCSRVYIRDSMDSYKIKVTDINNIIEASTRTSQQTPLRKTVDEYTRFITQDNRFYESDGQNDVRSSTSKDLTSNDRFSSSALPDVNKSVSIAKVAPRKVAVFKENRPKKREVKFNFKNDHNRPCCSTNLSDTTIRKTVHADKTTYCRPVLNIYTKAYIDRTTEKNTRLLRLVKKLIEARKREKNNEAWKNFINELKNKHGYSLDQNYAEYPETRLIHDFYEDSYSPGRNLIRDIYDPCTRGIRHKLPETIQTPYCFKNDLFCYPTSSQGRLQMLERERLKGCLANIGTAMSRNSHGNTILVEKNFNKAKRNLRRKYGTHSSERFYCSATQTDICYCNHDGVKKDDAIVEENENVINEKLEENYNRIPFETTDETSGTLQDENGLKDSVRKEEFSEMRDYSKSYAFIKNSDQIETSAAAINDSNKINSRGEKRDSIISSVNTTVENNNSINSYFKRSESVDSEYKNNTVSINESKGRDSIKCDDKSLKTDVVKNVTDESTQNEMISKREEIIATYDSATTQTPNENNETNMSKQNKCCKKYLQDINIKHNVDSDKTSNFSQNKDDLKYIDKESSDINGNEVIGISVEKNLDPQSEKRASLSEDTTKQRYLKVSENVARLKERITTSKNDLRQNSRNNLETIENKLDLLINTIQSLLRAVQPTSVPRSDRCTLTNCISRDVKSRDSERSNEENDSLNVSHVDNHASKNHKNDRYVCSASTNRSSGFPYSERYKIDTSASKLDEILIEEIDKSNQAKRDIEDILNGEKKPCAVQITFDIPTKEISTEVTASLSKTRIYLNQNDGLNCERMTMAVNTDPLSLLALFRVSTETIRRLLSSMYFNYNLFLPMIQMPQLSRQLVPPVNQALSYVCSICGAVFGKTSHLSEHVQSHDLGIVRDCCVCRHMLDMRTRQAPGMFRCRYCSQSFTRAYCCELHQQECARRRGIRHEANESLTLLR